MLEVKDEHNQTASVSQFAHFHRQFLGEPNDPDSSEVVIARVMEAGGDPALFASLSFKNEFDQHVILRFDAQSEDEARKSMAKVDMLESVVSNFVESVRNQLDIAMKNMKNFNKE